MMILILWKIIKTVKKCQIIEILKKVVVKKRKTKTYCSLILLRGKERVRERESEREKERSGSRRGRGRTECEGGFFLSVEFRLENFR